MTSSNQDYLNFELNIETLDGNRLRISVSDSPVGSVSAEVVNPFTANEIEQVIGALDGSIKLSRGDSARIARAFGEKLFNTIFSGQIYAAFLASRERAGDNGLRVKLCLEDADGLEHWPWELLRDPRTDYLALSRQTPVMRYPRVLSVRPLVEVRLPLRVLVMISSPTDQAKLDVDAEWQTLMDATTDLRNRGLIELERLDNAQLITLQRKLREGTPYQIFHFIGHAAFDERSQTGMLAFEDARTHMTVPVSGESLARELSEENSIQLVVLNACQGARENSKDPFAGIASSIVARGVPAVVAMQFPISDNASRVFSQEFYRALSEGYSIEGAISEARRAISSTLNNLEWVTPVLYLRAPSGILFPRRQSEVMTISTGGFREILRSRTGLTASALIVLLLVGGIFLLSKIITPPPPGAITPTAVVTVEARDVDLTITSLRFLPRNPVPGQRVTVALVIKNNGTDERGSGPFKWAWYAGTNPQDNNPQPDMVGEVSNLAPGTSLNVKDDFYFGYWGTFSTIGWVNFDSKAPETNPFNNLKTAAVITSTDPFVVDFSVSPINHFNPLLESQTLKTDEFAPWGLQIAPQPDASNTACKDALTVLRVQDNTNQVGTALAGQNDVCTALPLMFKLDKAVGGASIDFMAPISGRYTLDLLDANNKRLGTGTVDATGGQTQTVKAPLTGPSLTTVQKVVFRGPTNANVAIQRVAFTYPGTLPITPTPSP